MAIHSSEDFIYHLGNKLKEYQNSDGSIICKDDQTHDHWDHLEAVSYTHLTLPTIGCV